MEKNMQGIQPRTLTNREFINFCADAMVDLHGMPKDWQKELLRRFIALAPLDEHPFIDPKQQNLF
jgi:DNA-nicking Smr family endonuclease